ncbi:MAG: T9SS type A sorting domain-containing protein [Bacteroidetes bacterium]|nr:T9SS type A sorting domain-containing protein [Bacteroidota bacterium]
MRLYPNPASEYVTIELPENKNAVGFLFSSKGEPFVTFNFTGNTKLSLKGFEPGLFFVLLNTDSKIYSSNAIERYGPPSVKGKIIRIKYCTQLPSPTPAIALFANVPQYIKEPYKRYIENQLRDNFNFTGVPVQIYFRQK